MMRSAEHRSARTPADPAEQCPALRGDLTAELPAGVRPVNDFPLPSGAPANMNSGGNGVCPPEWENRLTVSALMTPATVRSSGFSRSENRPKAGLHPKFMLAYLWVAIGGALGSMVRYGIGGLVSDKFGGSFPWGTFAVNVTGSFVIGFLGALTASEGKLTPQSRVLVTQFLITGVCGGYTTFSSFSLQTLNLLRDREWLYAGGNVLLSVFACMIAVWLGFALGSTINSMKGN